MGGSVIHYKVFKGIAQKSKSTKGWFFGYKLHLVINTNGEIMSFRITGAKTDDRKPLPDMLQKLKGWLFADKGYIGQDFYEKLKQQGIEPLQR